MLQTKIVVELQRPQALVSLTSQLTTSPTCKRSECPKLMPSHFSEQISSYRNSTLNELVVPSRSTGTAPKCPVPQTINLQNVAIAWALNRPWKTQICRM
ncbi:hypothetical protein EUGRSUZ_H00029 [Eucalyptus grandis]|uniref:Uncharacterized protein n=2 Tax=Eucalyptus grandis TaxID=71139 RepID=A0ACC3JLA1_EUCGR|nr:hypothetical protein EUGRSUZ_H00029 [Eucalyptus grandis]